ncbi:tyrosine-type recombinase/integrase [Candidatus Binatus sp.]|uniref:tyrosine-type recombinase/integrase n=1 Tax=Candidatus Binatus sp. TaxID=2811406 RepID=UPI003C59B473
MSTARRQGWEELSSGFLRVKAIERGLAANTLATYQLTIADLRRFCEAKHYQPCELDPAAVVEWLESTVARGVSHATRRLFYSCVRSFSAYLVRLGVLKSNGASVLKLRPGQRPLPRVPSCEALDALIRSIDPVSGERRDARDYLMIRVASECGLRVSELVSLTAGQLDSARGMVHVRGKGSKERIVPVNPDLMARLVKAGALADPADGAHLFITRLGKPMVRQGFNKVLRERCATAEVPTMHPHALRHAYATSLLDGGADTLGIRELLGHADVGTTQIYAHVATAKLRAVYRRFHPRA